MENKIFYTYILLTERNTFYCGYTDDIEKRYYKHCQGTGAKYTRANKPVSIEYLVNFKDKSSAMKEECKIKNLTKPEKIELIENFKKNKNKLYKLAKRITEENAI